MLKFNEKARVRKDLKADIKYDNIYCHNGMLKFAGQEVTIGDFKTDDRKVFWINEDLEGYLWSESMLENH